MISLSWDIQPSRMDVAYLKRSIPDLGCMGTGGGCTALYKEFPDGYHVYITGATNPDQEPEDKETQVYIGFFDPEGTQVVPEFMLVDPLDPRDRDDDHILAEDLSIDDFDSGPTTIEKAIEYIRSFSEYHD